MIGRSDPWQSRTARAFKSGAYFRVHLSVLCLSYLIVKQAKRCPGKLGGPQPAWGLIDQRRHYQQLALQAALDLAAAHQTIGTADQATAVLERACAIDPDSSEP